MTSSNILMKSLVEMQRRAFKLGAWFRVLNRCERAIVSLTIRCVKKIRSQKLADIVAGIVKKLKEAVKSPMRALIEKLGCLLAKKVCKIAQAWGNPSAANWEEDKGFLQYLTVMRMNTPRLFLS